VSEPSQLYARVRLSRRRLDEFLATTIPDPSGDAELLSWLADAEYHGERYTPELIRERVVSDMTVGAWVSDLMTPAPHGIVMPARNVYDAQSETWMLAALDFSENYDDYLTALGIFRAVANYKDLPGDDGFLIYGFLFEDSHVVAALQLGIGASQFLDEEAAAPLVAEADVAMEALMAEGAAGTAGA
jgi:hypothetical protein